MEIYDDSKSYTKREKDYMKFDFKILCKWQLKGITQEWGIDIANLTNNYNIVTNQIDYIYQQEILPVGIYRIIFNCI